MIFEPPCTINSKLPLCFVTITRTRSLHQDRLYPLTSSLAKAYVKLEVFFLVTPRRWASRGSDLSSITVSSSSEVKKFQEVWLLDPKYEVKSICWCNNYLWTGFSGYCIYISHKFYVDNLCYYFFSTTCHPLVGKGLLIVEDSKSHSDKTFGWTPLVEW